jgi:CRP-like cAMP-binding protein
MPGDRIGGGTVLYKRGVTTSTFTLILQGFVNIWAGEDAFHSEIGAWRHLGERVLTEGDYVPDFTVVTDGSCRVLQISRTDFLEACNAARMACERIGSMPMSTENLPVAKIVEDIQSMPRVCRQELNAAIRDHSIVLEPHLCTIAVPLCAYDCEFKGMWAYVHTG